MEGVERTTTKGKESLKKPKESYKGLEGAKRLIRFARFKLEQSDATTGVQGILGEALELLDCLSDPLAEVRKDIQEIKRAIESPAPTTATTASMPPPARSTLPADRTTRIRIKNKDKLSAEQLVDKVHRCGPTWAAVVAARPTRAGFQLVSKDAQSKDRIEEKIKDLTRALGTTVSVITKGYPVQVHRVKKKNLGQVITSKVLQD